jgi:alpha-tubulin suppressor-like RCC1 family protein
VLAWGSNDAGQLGNGTTGNPRPTPAPVPLPAGDRATAVTAGEGDSLAALAGGGVVGWGDNSDGSLGDGRTNDIAPSPVRTLMSPGIKVTSLFAGCFHTLALTSTGTVMAWGDNGNGQLGIGSPQDSSTFPVRVPLPQFGQVASIGGGCVHSVVVTDRGQALSWGAGDLLGNGGATSSSSPVVVRLPAGQAAIGTGGSAAGDFSLAILRPAQ